MVEIAQLAGNEPDERDDRPKALRCLFDVREYLPTVEAFFTHKAVLFYLASFANPDGSNIIQSSRSIARKFGCARNTAIAAINFWVRKGILVIDQPGRDGRGHAPMYSIHLPETGRLATRLSNSNGPTPDPFTKSQTGQLKNLNGSTREPKRVNLPLQTGQQLNPTVLPKDLPKNLPSSSAMRTQAPVEDLATADDDDSIDSSFQSEPGNQHRSKPQTLPLTEEEKLTPEQACAERHNQRVDALISKVVELRKAEREEAEFLRLALDRIADRAHQNGTRIGGVAYLQTALDNLLHSRERDEWWDEWNVVRRRRERLAVPVVRPEHEQLSGLLNNARAISRAEGRELEEVFRENLKAAGKLKEMS